MSEHDPDVPIVRIAFEEALAAYEPAPVHLRIAALISTAAPSAADDAAESPEIDTAQPIVFSVRSNALPGREAGHCLTFSEVEALPDRVVRCTVEPSESLLGLDPPSFDKLVREAFAVTVRVRLKANAVRSSATVRGRFLVKVEARVRIHWVWSGHPSGFPEASGRDDTIMLHADGLSGFKLVVSTTEWRPKEQRFVASDPEKYEFTHWIAPDDRRIKTDVFAPKPLPWLIERANRQDVNEWVSVAALPDPQGFPELGRLPILTVIRVKAWHRHSIEERFENHVKASEPEVAEVEIPVRLVRCYVLSIAVVIEGDDKPLKTYEVTVNGERVQIYCIHLPPDLRARLLWRVVGPSQVAAPSSAAPRPEIPVPRARPPGKRRFRTEEQETPLAPVQAPSGEICLGTAGEIEIVEQPCSDADPPVFLDVEAVALGALVEIVSTRDAIRGDDKDRTTIRVRLLATRPDGTLDAVKELKATFRASARGRLVASVDAGDRAPPLRSPDGAEIDLCAEWTEKQGEKITVSVEVEIALEGRSEPLRTTASTAVEIIGADTRCWLEGPGGVETDGTSSVTLTPVLEMFGERYWGSLTLRRLAYDKNLFAASPDEPDDLDQATSVRLRCKFHLQDTFLGATREAGSMPSTRISVRATPVDPEVSKHLPSEGIFAEKALVLHPCRIVCERPAPELLPRESPELGKWQSRVSARVLSASGRGVSGQTILRDSNTFGAYGGGAPWFDRFQWGFAFDYAPEIGPWATPLDDQPGHHEQRIHSIDHSGQIMFANPAPEASLVGPGGRAVTGTLPYLNYDHWQHFYDTRARYLRGLGCEVWVTFGDGSGNTYPCGPIRIADNAPETLRVRVIAQSNEVLEGASVEVHPKDRAGPPIAGTTDEDGLATLKNVKSGNCTIRATWRAPLSSLTAQLTTAIQAVESLENKRLGLLGPAPLGAPAVREKEVEVGAKRFHELILPCSSIWSLQGNVDVSVEINDVGAAYFQFYLFNRATSGIERQRERQRNICFAGPSFGLPGSFSLPTPTADPFPSSEPFRTFGPVHFDDFAGPGAVFTAAEVNFAVGGSVQHAAFGYVDHEPALIDVGGLQIGGFGYTIGNAAVGRWTFLD